MLLGSSCYPAQLYAHAFLHNAPAKKLFSILRSDRIDMVSDRKVRIGVALAVALALLRRARVMCD